MGVGVLSVDSVSGFKQLVPLIGPEKELLNMFCTIRPSNVPFLGFFLSAFPTPVLHARHASRPWDHEAGSYSYISTTSRR
ncbi:hypothetical protein QC764_0007090 [Podospora pseudoanserina]|uniref:Uncharacterized protein n=1 Tax=Podospora pseudoanserina TaxID=2609844 RepID=A0ABR0IMF5_9PEZI|nr:hypothetical protein QC764_0007090 [Podospora pseudoanserina]